MGLSGTLEAFPLSEVLRLLSRSGQTGRLYAQSGVEEMRAYLVGGRLVIAWDGSDESFGDELIGRGLIGTDAWEDVAAGGVPCEQALTDGVSPLEFDRAIRDITIEGLAKMVDGRSGTFAFEDGNTTPLRLGTDLELDAVLAGVGERLQDWRRLRAIVPDLSQTLEFRRAVPGETVELSPTAWNFLVSLLPVEPLDSLIELTGRSSTSVIEDLVELLESDRAQISGYVTPAAVDAGLEEAEERPSGDGTEHLAYIGDDPLGGFGPIGWENELGAIPASDETEDDDGESLPLLGDDDASFLAEAGEEPGGFDFGLVGLDMAPNKGRNLLEKDGTWDAFNDFLEADDADPTPNRVATSRTASAEPRDVTPLSGSSGPGSGDDTPEPTVEAAAAAGEHEAENVLEEELPDVLEASEVGGPGEDPETDPPAEPRATDLEEMEDIGSERSVAMIFPVEAEGPDNARDDLDELASVLSHLGQGGRDEADTDQADTDEDDFEEGVVVIEPDTTPVEGIFPYHGADPATPPGVEEVAGESVTDDPDADEDDGEGPRGGLPGVLRRRSRGALARELRSLSD